MTLLHFLHLTVTSGSPLILEELGAADGLLFTATIFLASLITLDLAISAN